MKWNTSSKQILLSKKTQDIVSKIEGQGYDFITSALQWVSKNIPIKKNHPNWINIFRKRTSDQIIDSGFSTGCTDTAIVFIALCRSKGFPTKYVETINKEWLNSDISNLEFRGHIFAEVYINNKWIIVDAESMTLHANNEYDNYVVFKKGLDSWDIGISSFDELKDRFLNYKKNLLQKKNRKN